jgi:hypothetical protein
MFAQRDPGSSDPQQARRVRDGPGRHEFGAVGALLDIGDGIDLHERLGRLGERASGLHGNGKRPRSVFAGKPDTLDGARNRSRVRYADRETLGRETRN